eukprot:jgi/Chrzof1/2114/Cz11g03040.t1
MLQAQQHREILKRLITSDILSLHLRYFRDFPQTTDLTPEEQAKNAVVLSFCALANGMKDLHNALLALDKPATKQDSGVFAGLGLNQAHWAAQADAELPNFYGHPVARNGLSPEAGAGQPGTAAGDATTDAEDQFQGGLGTLVLAQMVALLLTDTINDISGSAPTLEQLVGLILHPDRAALAAGLARLLR